jgi:predicted DNA-binding transcriptional regulator AlpA
MPNKRWRLTPTHLKALLSIEEAAEMLGIHRCTLYRSIDRGDFPLPLFSDQRPMASPP